LSARKRDPSSTWVVHVHVLVAVNEDVDVNVDEV
jgi:hypothetical protein